MTAGERAAVLAGIEAAEEGITAIPGAAPAALYLSLAHGLAKALLQAEHPAPLSELADMQRGLELRLRDFTAAAIRRKFGAP